MTELTQDGIEEVFRLLRLEEQKERQRLVELGSVGRDKRVAPAQYFFRAYPSTEPEEEAPSAGLA